MQALEAGGLGSSHIGLMERARMCPATPFQARFLPHQPCVLTPSKRCTLVRVRLVIKKNVVRVEWKELMEEEDTPRNTRVRCTIGGNVPKTTTAEQRFQQ